jgi:predicted ATPase with chaperone activity
MREKKPTPIDNPDRIMAGLLRTLWNRRQYRNQLLQQINAELTDRSLTKGQRAYREKRKQEIETEVAEIEESARTLRRLNQVPITLADNKERVLSYSLDDLSKLNKA